MLIWEMALMLMALGVSITAFGYNLTLGGYSHRKLLEGVSVSSQMIKRRRIGKEVMHIGVIVMVSAVLTALIMGMLIQVKTREIIPKELNIMVAQGKTIIIMDGETHIVEGERHSIKRVYLTGQINCYGFKYWESITIEDKDQWEITEQWRTKSTE